MFEITEPHKQTAARVPLRRSELRRRGVVAVTSLERSPDHHTVAGGGDLDLGVAEIDDRPRRAADERCGTEGSETDRGDEPRPVFVHRGVELFLRLAALVVVEGERVVGAVRVHGGDAAANEGEHPGTSHIAAGRDLLLRRDERLRGEGDRRRDDERTADEHRTLRRPHVAGHEAERGVEVELRHPLLHAGVVELPEGQRSALGVADDLGRCSHEAAIGVLARGAGGDGDGVRQVELRDVVRRFAVRLSTDHRALIARGIQQPQALGAQARGGDSEVSKRQATASTHGVAGVELPRIHVAIRDQTGHGDGQVSVDAALVPELRGEVREPRCDLGGRRVVHEDEDIDVAALGERREHRLALGFVVGARVFGHVLPLRLRDRGAPEHDGHGLAAQALGAAGADHGDVAPFRRGGRAGGGGFGREGRGEGEEKEQAGHGF